MSEAFLYFLWQHQYLSSTDLRTTEGKVLQVRYPGLRNADSGPDFTNARLLIDGVEWVGTVEAHLKTSDWRTHRHQHDRAYDSVILHIVWENDRAEPERRSDGTAIPTLCLRDWVDPELLRRYRHLCQQPSDIPCASQLPTVAPIHHRAMLDRTVLERLARKAEAVNDLYGAAGQDWDETAYRLLAASFGFGVNNEPMARLSRQVPLRVLQKHRNQSLQVEALLFGVAGLLPADSPVDPYESALLREYRFLAAKYQLVDRQLPAHTWKWSRLRPANFPTVRLAQLVQVLVRHGSLSSVLLSAETVPELRQLLMAPLSAYWQTHYRFGSSTGAALTGLGEQAADTLIINAIAPLLLACARHRGQPALQDRAIALLEALPAETNRLTRRWRSLGLAIRNAFDSQGALELHRQYCEARHCLSCCIGLQLVRAEKKPGHPLNEGAPLEQTFG